MERQVFDEAEDPRKVDPTLAPMVFTILNRLMRKRPGERYQSAANLIVDLEAAMGQIRSGLPTSRFSRTPVPAKRPGSRGGSGGDFFLSQRRRDAETRENGNGMYGEILTEIPNGVAVNVLASAGASCRRCGACMAGR